MKKENLHKIKATGFKIPENYFESFEARLNERLKENRSISVIKTTGFAVPEAYFETVENKVIDTINTENKKGVFVLKPRRTFYYVAGVAASIALVFSIMFNQKSTVTIHSLDTVAIESYLYQEDYTNAELASLFNTEEISETDFIDFYISEETLDQYLDTIETEELILE